MKHELRIMVFIVLSILLYSLFMIQPVYAQESTNYQLPTYIPPTSPLYTDLLVHNMFHTFSCLGIGQSVIGQPCLNYIQGVPYLSSVNTSGGVLGTTTSLIGALYLNPPVRTADYLASVGQGLGIVKEANAQVVGSGAGVLNPILKLWEVSRNISYVLMIIIFVIIGLMVMFRTKINPQTVITAQAALPGLVIGLILITFSYFMAALITDTAFIGTNLVGAYFSTARGDTQNLVQDLNSTYSDYKPDPSGRKPNLISIFSKFAAVANKEKVTEVLNSFWNDINVDAQRLLVTLAGFVVAQITGQTFEGLKAIPKVGEGIIIGIQTFAVLNTLTGPIGPTAVIGAVLALIVTAILLYAMFKLLIRLISVYLTIIFLTITAPFQFLAAALPGRQGMATGWILDMLANVLAFPAVIAVFYFVAFILGPTNGPYGPLKVSDSGGGVGSSFVTTAKAANTFDIVGTNAFPLFGGMSLDFIRLLLAFGALVATPVIPDIIAKMMDRVSQAGQLIGQEVGGGIAAGRGYGQQLQQGVGSASGNLARSRGLFNTPGYELIEADGKTQVRETYDPGRGASPGWLARRGIWVPTRKPKTDLKTDLKK